MRRYVTLLVAACCIIALLYANGLNLFVVEADSDEAVKHIIVKGIELQRDVANPIVCSDNIQGYNLTGYTLMR